MTKPEFKLGDIVRLTSGGPFMTVTKISDPCGDWPSGLIAVAWFGEGEALHRDGFAPGALVADERPIGAPKQR